MNFSYPVGALGWKIVALCGVPLKLKVDITFSDGLWYALSNDLPGLAVTADTPHELAQDIHEDAAFHIKEAIKQSFKVIRDPSSKIAVRGFDKYLNHELA